MSFIFYVAYIISGLYVVYLLRCVYYFGIVRSLSSYDEKSQSVALSATVERPDDVEALVES